MSGICDYATFCETIFTQLDEKTFKEHFGFEKYVTIDGKLQYNPELLADFVLEVNSEGISKNPDFIRNEDGSYRLRDGKLKKNGLRKYF